MCRVPRVAVLSRVEASLLLGADAGLPVDAVISIHTPQGYPCDGFDSVPHTLELGFDDVDIVDQFDPVAGFRSRMKQRKDADVGLSSVPPSQEHIQQIIAFADRTKAIDGTLLCHCDAGISRSPAAALICLARWMGPGHERDAAGLVQALRPLATPHRGMIRLADELLNLEGQLREATEAVFGA